MRYRDLNDRGLYSMRMNQFMQEGGEPQNQQVEESPMQQMIPQIKAAMQQGASVTEIIMALAQNQVPMEAIQQVLVSAGIDQGLIVSAFQELQQQQAQAQAQVDSMEGPIEAEPEGPVEIPGQGVQIPPEASVPEAVDTENVEMAQAQDGEEIGFAQLINNDGPTVGGNIPEYQESLVNEEIISEYRDKDGKIVKDPYEYRKTVDGNTGGVFYERRRKDRKGKYKDWTDAGKEGSDSYRAITHIFGDDKTDWENSPEKAEHVKGMQQDYTDMIERQKAEAERKKAEELMRLEMEEAKTSGQYPTIDEIISGGYKTKVIMYPKGYGNMPPGHIESILIGPDGTPYSYYLDEDGVPQHAFVNRWENTKDGGSRFFHDNIGPDNRREAYFKTKEALKRRLEGEGIRHMDLDLTEDEMRRFLRSTAGEYNRDYKFDSDNCADGVCRAYGIDDATVGNTFRIGSTLTDPDMVYQTILNNYGDRAHDLGAGPMGRAEQLKRMLNVPRNADRDPRNTIQVGPSAEDIIDAGSTVHKVINQSPESNLWDLMEWLGFDMSFKNGGQPAKYSDVLKQAQYGLGVGNYQTFNQYFGNRDKNFKRNPRANYMPMNLGMKGDPIAGLGNMLEAGKSLFSKKDKDGDGLADGSFRDIKAKRNLNRAARAESYEYDTQVDPDDPNTYLATKQDLFEASRRNPDKRKGLMTQQDKIGQIEDQAMLKYNPEEKRYDVANNNPMFQSKYESLRPDLTGYKSFSELSGQMQGLSSDEQDALRNLSTDLTDFTKEKKAGNLPEGIQFGMDERGGIGYYDKDAELPEGSNERINQMMMQNYKKGGSYDNPGFKALPPAVQAKIMKEAMFGIETSPMMYAEEGDEMPAAQKCRCGDGSMRSSCCQEGYSDPEVRGKSYTGMFGRKRQLPRRHRKALEKYDVNYDQNLTHFEQYGAKLAADAPSNFANIDMSSLTPEQKKIVESYSFRDSPNLFKDQIPKDIYKQINKVNRALEWQPIGKNIGNNPRKPGYPSDDPTHMDKIRNRREARKDFRSGQPKPGARRHDVFSDMFLDWNVFGGGDGEISAKWSAMPFREVYGRKTKTDDGTSLRHWSNLWRGQKDKSDFRDFYLNPFSQGAKFARQNRQPGGEIEGEPVGNEVSDLNTATQAMRDAEAAYKAEEERVMGIRKAIADRARDLGERGATPSEAGLSQNLTNYVENTGFGCNTYSCQIMRDAGVTIPEGTEPFKLNGRTYNPGDKLPIIPGNSQFNSYADKLGFELQPKGTMPTEEGDLIRGHMYSTPANAGSGAFHSVLSAGYGDDDFLDLYNNPGGVYDGYQSRADYENDPMRTGIYEDGREGYYETDSGVMRYVGDMNTLREKRDAAVAEYQRLRDLARDSEYLDNPGMLEERSLLDADYGATRRFGGAMDMNMMQQQMMHQQALAKLMEEVKQASPKKQYRKKAPQDTVELTTEQIAKIMAAGGSVKIL